MDKDRGYYFTPTKKEKRSFSVLQDLEIDIGFDFNDNQLEAAFIENVKLSY